ncbi:YHYH domain-containing protein [Paenibacillus sp. FSL W8-1187]|uniref:YHYH domain-containing protein n=1 Tax=Paenibacillus TaxID=44249 RepID=UPI000C7E469B|nr:YHYH domain-containing protein [Paenibacillus pasadenensis]
MKKLHRPAVVIILLLSLLSLPLSASAHSGRTDSSGGHNCSEKSIRKGLCTGYHYHNGGGSSSSSSSESTSSSTAASSKKSTTVRSVIANEAKPQAHCTKVSDVLTGSSSQYRYYERIWDCRKSTDSGAKYEETSLSLYVDEKLAALDKGIVSLQQTNYISLRDFSRLFGFSLDVAKTKVSVVKQKKTAFEIEAQTRKINGSAGFSGFKAIQIEGAYYVPLRYAAGMAGASIVSADSRSIELSTKR